jgi:hypothetical protein
MPSTPSTPQVRFGRIRLRKTPGNQAISEAPMEPSAATAFKPRNMTDDIFLAQILVHKLLPGAAALS